MKVSIPERQRRVSEGLRLAWRRRKLVGTTYTLTIPNWHPARLNQWEGRHWSVKAKLKKGDRELVIFYSRLAGIPQAHGKRRVSLAVVLTKAQRSPDIDAFWKSTLDALVQAKLLKDDSPKWCELGSVEYERGSARATRITLEECDGS